MSFEISGTLHKVYDIESKSGSFQTREFVLATDGQYPQYCKFQLTQDRCSIIDSHKEGDKIKVYFDLRGREWQGKYFTNLNAWKMERDASTTSTANSIEAQSGNFPPIPPSFDTMGGSDSGSHEAGLPGDFNDLPF
jgi:single-strand DNA-binding protein